MWKKHGNPEQVSMSVSLVQLLKKKKMKVLGFLLLLLFFCPHLLSLSSLFVLLCFVPLQEPVSCFIKTLTGLTLCEHQHVCPSSGFDQ